MNPAQLNQQNPLNKQPEEPQSVHSETPYQPQPIVMPSKASSKKMDPIKISMIALSVALLAGAIFGTTALGSKNSSESKAGLAYIKAVHSKDAASLEAVADPTLVQVGNKIAKLGGTEAKEGFYKSIATANGKQAGSSAGGDIKEVKVTKQASDGVKYAYVTYQAGSKNTTILESYDNGTPKVISVSNGSATYDTDKFKSEYQAYQTQMKQMGKMVDQIAQGAGSNSREVVQSLFEVK